ncbi:CDP-diacylglycerol diphosphatase [Mycolicibacterium sediminis]|uniref:CDP-diacylglycerol diphosphatase n=1 Tax=Mycolicibacterium sediminis TaxID=1286180 RepID=A0A7I7QKZ1_9MYCO|nr:CDP-diacylglycerol diphosphatase [Mycolicibacterium sediminis]BBY26637.1 CDP-diacylglycerol diphosphatase [Mycolicibacterium sediminis]
MRRVMAMLAALVVGGSIGAAAAGPPAAADPNALWTIVHDQCVPHQRDHADPSPCALVADDGPGGHAVLKDLVGRTQYLLIPTARIAGIESPELLAPGAPNYFADAWRARTFVEQRAGVPLPRDWVSLAINSTFARSQNQLHIHVDCVRADVRDAVARHVDELGPGWSPFPDMLVGHRYEATTVAGDDLYGADPFVLLANGLPGARDDMGSRTLVVVGTQLSDGRPGFVVLADRADPVAGDLAEGEELQDHETCPPPAGQWRK